MNKQSIDYTNQDFFLGIDLHKKSWKVTVRTSGMELKTFSMDPSPEQLYHYMDKRYPRGRSKDASAGLGNYRPPFDKLGVRFGFCNPNPALSLP